MTNIYIYDQIHNNLFLVMNPDKKPYPHQRFYYTSFSLRGYPHFTNRMIFSL